MLIHNHDSYEGPTSELVEEIKRRCFFLLERFGYDVPVNWGSGRERAATLGEVIIRFETFRGLRIFVLTEENRRREAWGEQHAAFSQGDESGEYYANQELLDDVVLPTMRRAMILDDIATVGGSGDDGQGADRQS